MSCCPPQGRLTLCTSSAKYSTSETPTDSSPSNTNFSRQLSPRQRPRSVSVPRSSRAPIDIVTASTVSGSRMLRRPERLVGTVTAATVPQISNPPIVGVPAFTAWVDGPSSEIALPTPPRRSNASTGMPASNANTKAPPPTSSA